MEVIVSNIRSFLYFIFIQISTVSKVFYLEKLSHLYVWEWFGLKKENFKKLESVGVGIYIFSILSSISMYNIGVLICVCGLV